MFKRNVRGKIKKEGISYEYVYGKYENFFMMVNDFYAFYRNI